MLTAAVTRLCPNLDNISVDGNVPIYGRIARLYAAVANTLWMLVSTVSLYSESAVCVTVLLPSTRGRYSL